MTTSTTSIFDVNIPIILREALPSGSTGHDTGQQQKRLVLLQLGTVNGHGVVGEKRS